MMHVKWFIPKSKDLLKIEASAKNDNKRPQSVRVAQHKTDTLTCENHAQSRENLAATELDSEAWKPYTFSFRKGAKINIP
jgi:hypothetical protein